MIGLDDGYRLCSLLGSSLWQWQLYLQNWRPYVTLH